jgi:hypothetical protein
MQHIDTEVKAICKNIGIINDAIYHRSERASEWMNVIDRNEGKHLRYIMARTGFHRVCYKSITTGDLCGAGYADPSV